MRHLLISLLLGSALVGCSNGNERKAIPEAGSTTTTFQPDTTIGTTTTTNAAQAAEQLAADKLKIRALIDRVNAAFRSSVDEGIAATVSENYVATYGINTAQECLAYRKREYANLREHYVLREDTIHATPGWYSTIVNAVPDGRLYGFTLDFEITEVLTGRVVGDPIKVHATVLPDGKTQMFWLCEDEP